MKINGVFIDDADAEAFAMLYSRVLVTAASDRWLGAAVSAATGLATSIVGCGAEAGVESMTANTPDGRPGANLLFFTRTVDKLKDQLIRRIGQAILTCPTTTVFDGGGGKDALDIGARLRYFGDGHEKVKTVHGRKMWSIPVTGGEFLVEENISFGEGVGGGSFLILAGNEQRALGAAERAVAAIDPLPGVILPFPGGVCRSASKVGSRYGFLKASTNERFCPTLKGGKVPEGVGSVMEIVIDGVSRASVEDAMRAGVIAACEAPGVVSISAQSFGGALGDVNISLRELIAM